LLLLKRRAFECWIDNGERLGVKTKGKGVPETRHSCPFFGCIILMEQKSTLKRREMKDTAEKETAN
jgi:hypothetical protein